MLTLSRWKIVLVTFSVIFGILFTLPNLLPQKTLDSSSGLGSQAEAQPRPRPSGRFVPDVRGRYRRPASSERLTNLVEDVRTALRGEQIAFGELGEANGVITAAHRRGRPRSMTRPTSCASSVGAPLARFAVGGRDVSVSHARQPAPGSHLRSRGRQGARRSRWRWSSPSRPFAAGSTAWAPRNRPSPARASTGSSSRRPARAILKSLKSVVGKTAKLTFQMVDESVTPDDIAAGRIPPGSEALPSEDRYQAVLCGAETRSWCRATSWSIRVRPSTARAATPSVSFKFNGSGSVVSSATPQPATLARSSPSSWMVKIISAPVINGAITWRLRDHHRQRSRSESAAELGALAALGRVARTAEGGSSSAPSGPNWGPTRCKRRRDLDPGGLHHHRGLHAAELRTSCSAAFR